NLRSTMTHFLSCAYPMTSLPLGMLGSLLDCGFTAFTRPHPHCLLDGKHEDLPVPDAARLGRGQDRLDHAAHQIVRHHDLELDLGDQVHRVFGAAVELGVALLPAHALHFAHGEAGHAGLAEGVLHRVELEGLDDRLDQLHTPATFCRTGAGASGTV